MLRMHTKEEEEEQEKSGNPDKSGKVSSLANKNF